MNSEDILKSGKSVLRLESESLQTHAEKLGSCFVEAVTLMKSVKGKIVVSGMGKSGHVARKVAATLSSTGSPAFFVHPSEALHGDSGMMQENDALLCFAYSGETKEVLRFVEAAKRRGIKIIALTGNDSSSLALLADVHINASVEKEADGYNIVPSTSSIVAMALGDALSLTLMKVRGFSDVDFAEFHPEGSLGKKLARVDRYAVKLNTLMVSMDTPFDELIKVVSAGSHGIVGVHDSKGSLVGAVTDGDLRRGILKLKEKIFSCLASDLMSQQPKTISENSLVVEAMNLMERSKITSLFVVQDHAEECKKPVGLIKLGDLLLNKVI